MPQPPMGPPPAISFPPFCHPSIILSFSPFPCARGVEEVLAIGKGRMVS